MRTKICARLPSIAKPRHEWIGEGAGWTARIAPAIPQARRSPAIRYRVNDDRQRSDGFAECLEALRQQRALGKARYAGHRIWIARPAPDFCYGIPGDTHFGLNAVIPGLQISVRDGPVHTTAEAPPNLEIFGREAGPCSVVVKSRSAEAGTRTKVVAHGVLSGGGDVGAPPFQAPGPDL